MSELTIPPIADLHVHLRQGTMMESVTATLPSSGASIVYVMPNLQPPITTTEQALNYKSQLESIAPSITYLMTLYLTPSLTPTEIIKAKSAGIIGVKSYPRGVTTNSESGIESYDQYYSVFKEMERVGMVLNIHGEVPSCAESNVCVMNAEQAFLKHLVQLHKDFPKLKIILEHASTKAAVECVKGLGDTVGCTITLHHLWITVDDWAGNPHNFCKPVAKYPTDREALCQVIREGHPRFFLGTDSAPHSITKKLTSPTCAGVFTSPFVAHYLVTILERIGAFDRIRDFGCEFGRQFYGIDERNEATKPITLVKKPFKVPEIITCIDGDRIVPFMHGQELDWSLE